MPAELARRSRLHGIVSMRVVTVSSAVAVEESAAGRRIPQSTSTVFNFARSASWPPYGLAGNGCGNDVSGMARAQPGDHGPEYRAAGR
eukprot:4129881-Lingulodinium_polyedra.AAC.1